MRHQSLEHRKRLSLAHRGKKYKPMSNRGKKNISEAQKGRIPWNKGLNKDTNSAIKKMAENRVGEKNWMWKGDKATYSSLHCWVRDHLGKPKKCIDCGSEKRVQWSNENGLYLRDLKDWKERCPKCNRLHDDKFKLNKARDKYPEIDKLFLTRYKR